MIARELAKQRTPSRRVPIELEVAQPVGGLDQRRSFTDRGVRDSDVIRRGAKLDSLPREQLPNCGSRDPHRWRARRCGIRPLGPLDARSAKTSRQVARQRFGFRVSTHLLQLRQDLCTRLRVEGIELEPVPAPLQGPIRSEVGMARQSLEHADPQAVDFFPFGREPTLEQMLLGQIEAIEERVLEPIGDRRQFVDREVLREPRLDRSNVDFEVEDVQRDSLAIRDQPFAGFIVDQRTKLVERPTKRRARIIRQFPQHFAEPISTMRPSGQREIGQQGARLLRRRQRHDLAAAPNRQLAQSMDREFHERRPCYVRVTDRGPFR